MGILKPISMICFARIRVLAWAESGLKLTKHWNLEAISL